MKQYISRVLTLAAVAGAMLWAPAALAADPVRIGFVNTDRLLRDAVPAKAARQRRRAQVLALDPHAALPAMRPTSTSTWRHA